MTWPISVPNVGDYRYFLGQVGGLLGFDYDPAAWSHSQISLVDSIVQRGVQRFYVPPPPPGERFSHEWSFLRPLATLTTAASDYDYDLPSDFAMLDGPMTFVPGSLVIYQPIEIVSEYEVRSQEQFGTYTGRPRIAAIRPKPFTVSGAQGSTTLRRDWKVDGVLVDPDSIVLSDPTATYGVKRNDTSAVVVAAGTAMTKLSTGVYEYTFQDPAAGLAYTGWVEISYGGNLYHFEHDIPAPGFSAGATRYEILMWPTPDEIYSIQYRYRVNPPLLSDSNSTPYGGAPHVQTILESCLGLAEQEKGVMGGPHATNFAERLMASISHDQRVASPSTVGYNRDRSGSLGDGTWLCHECDENIVTYNNLTY